MLPHYCLAYCLLPTAPLLLHLIRLELEPKPLACLQGVAVDHRFHLAKRNFFHSIKRRGQQIEIDGVQAWQIPQSSWLPAHPGSPSRNYCTASRPRVFLQ